MRPPHMASTVPAAVAVTDDAWFAHFAREAGRRVIDEVNFWRPLAQSQEFRIVPTGGPVFFRLKAPRRAIAGYGFYAGSLEMSVNMAWEYFGEKNGYATYSSFVGRLSGYLTRYGQANADAGTRKLTCLVLREATFLPQSDWLPWDKREEWADTVVSFKGYDLASGVGTVLADLLASTDGSRPPDLDDEFSPLMADTRTFAEVSEPLREGQGAFRVRLLSAYGSACAVTREHALPVLEAAHIQPYLGPASNHVQNGLILRTDLHRLYDVGYVTVTPELRLEVSARLKDEFDNGRTYYEMAGRTVAVPSDPRLRPSRDALLWHADHVFR